MGTFQQTHRVQAHTPTICRLSLNTGLRAPQLPTPHKHLQQVSGWQHCMGPCRAAAVQVVSLSGSMQSAEAQARQQPVSTSSRTAKEVVTEFYSNYNAGNVDGIMGLMADNCEYHDMIYAEAFRGKREVRAFFDKAVATIPSDLKFRIDAISDHDPRFVGLKWHCDIDGHEFPFSRGCSFYEVNEQGLIVSGRDLVESAVKPGGAALQALRLLAPLVRMLGPNANPAKLKELPIAAGLVWAFYAGYMTYIMGNVGAPGDPIWATSAQTLKEVLHESLNFFYVNIFLNKVGITFIPDLAEHPTSEALFNFVNAWSMMFLPVMLSDKKGAGVKNKLPLWLGTQFLTNVFFVPYMALRELINRLCLVVILKSNVQVPEKSHYSINTRKIIPVSS
ncbi:hypothetical protein WJX72_002086 [[Myrmecia] bisecta]|uniref:SnoaL-like domain-containing protein n=1 Tax=[Myrmecia] bisecta TaxID=41462 RepID=A0AAW1R4V0_9CHLO